MDECTPEERELAQARADGAVVYIGNVCTQKKGLCVASRSVYCAFKEGGQWNKEAYLTQIIVRQKLNLSFGTASQPDCRGLSQHQVLVGSLMFMDGITRSQAEQQAEQMWANNS